MLSTLVMFTIVVYPITTLSLAWRVAWLFYFTVKYIRTQIQQEPMKEKEFHEFVVVD